MVIKLNEVGEVALEEQSSDIYLLKIQEDIPSDYRAIYPMRDYVGGMTQTEATILANEISEKTGKHLGLPSLDHLKETILSDSKIKDILSTKYTYTCHALCRKGDRNIIWGKKYNTHVIPRLDVRKVDGHFRYYGEKREVRLTEEKDCIDVLIDAGIFGPSKYGMCGNRPHFKRFDGNMYISPVLCHYNWVKCIKVYADNSRLGGSIVTLAEIDRKEKCEETLIC